MVEILALDISHFCRILENQLRSVPRISKEVSMEKYGEDRSLWVEHRVKSGRTGVLRVLYGSYSYRFHANTYRQELAGFISDLPKFSICELHDTISTGRRIDTVNRKENPRINFFVYQKLR